jgi:TRAP-type C4-dicarboxylate transport system permease small subunit
VQSIRGHVGIEAIASLLSPPVEAARRAGVDLLCLAFCALFAWKSWTLLREAWVDGQTTSSSWAPPLWIPYLLMTLGMTLLAVQLLVHLAASLNRPRAAARER